MTPLLFYFVVGMATTRYYDRVGMFDILKRVTLLCIRALSEIFSLFLGVDVSDNWRVWISAFRVMTCVIYQ